MVLLPIFLFVIGTFFGSFLSVVIYRIHKNEKGIFFGRSQCPHCNYQLKARDLIPIISYLINHGKCRNCKKKISINYLLIELFTGIIFVAFYLIYQSYIYMFFIIISLFLIAIFFYDLQYMEIPEIFTFPAIILIFIVEIFMNEPGLYSSVIGGAIAGIFFGSQVWLSKEKWLGKGDVEVGILMGLLLGWKLFLIALFITYILGSIISLFLLAFKKAKLKSQLPFAPFMIVGIFITLFFGEYLLNLYLNSLI